MTNQLPLVFFSAGNMHFDQAINAIKMIKNYFKIALRSLLRSKIHSAVNIIGLCLGIACCILIALFVRDELTYDRFHDNADRIYRVYGREDWGENQDFFYTVTPFPMGPTLKENFSEVETFVRIVKIATQVRVGAELFNETLTIADRPIFEVFNFKVTHGNRLNLFDQQRNIVISEWAAKKYFGDVDPLGKTLSLQLAESFEDFTVSGVAELPENSSIQFYLLISDLNFPVLYSEQTLTSQWFNINPETYVLLKNGVDPQTVTDKFPSVFKTILGEEDFKKSKYAPGLQPLTTIHLDTSFPAGIAPVSNPEYTYILSAIALLILVVGCINFVTLSVGRSLKRAKEVGIRKVVGALRIQLIAQFIGEAVILTTISMVAGLLVAYISLSLFNDLSGKQLVFQIDGFVVGIVVTLLLIIGMIAGSYPAFVLSGFKPVAILKGGLPGKGTNKQTVRKALVGVQLVLSIFLISSTLIMGNQLEFLQKKNLGFNKEQLVVIRLNVPRGRLAERVEKGFEKAEQFKTALAKFPEVISVCASSHDFANGSWTNVGYTDDKGTYRTFYLNVIDDEYIPTMKMELGEGRNFTDDSPSDKRRGVIVNEAFLKAYGWTGIEGKRIPGKNFGDHEIIGVVKDFNYASLYTTVEPLVLVASPALILSGIENINIDNSPVPKLIVRVRPGDIMGTVENMKAVWENITGGEEFNFTFVDQALSVQYRADQNLGRIVRTATILAIIIGSLGLYGLASLAMQNRVKEISVRKVFGATERSLLVLLSKDYLYLIAVSLLLSVPLTLLWMNNWLSSFKYRIDIGAKEFLLAGGISLLIAVATVSHQAIKTAWSQPADTLKHE